MTSVIHNINLDCADQALLISPDGSLNLLFIAGPDLKTVKNRMHLDLRPTDRTRTRKSYGYWTGGESGRRPPEP